MMPFAALGVGFLLVCAARDKNVRRQRVMIGFHRGDFVFNFEIASVSFRSAW
jgi:hypothetical protein